MNRNHLPFFIVLYFKMIFSYKNRQANDKKVHDKNAVLVSLLMMPLLMLLPGMMQHGLTQTRTSA
jgi:hypothetical protein